MNKLTIAPRWTWEDPGPDIGPGVPEKSHGFGGNLCHSGKVEKKSLGVNKASGIFPGV